MTTSYYSIKIDVLGVNRFIGYFRVEAGYVVAFLDYSLSLNNKTWIDVLLPKNDPESYSESDNLFDTEILQLNINGLNFYSLELRNVFGLPSSHFNLYYLNSTGTHILYQPIADIIVSPQYTISIGSVRGLPQQSTSVMPPHLYPSSSDSMFSAGRATFVRANLSLTASTNIGVAEATKRKQIYDPHNASSRMERLKMQAIGQGSMRVKLGEELRFKAPNVNDTRDALRRMRSGGYVVPAKVRARN